MNAAFLHIATNHIPVIAMPFAVALLLVGLVRSSQEVIRISFAAFVIIALITIFVDRTGGPAARMIKNLPAINRADIHAHAEAADYAFAVTEVLGGLALVSLWMTRGGRSSTAAAALVLIGALMSCASLARVAHLGGLIRHPEIHWGNNPQTVATVPSPPRSLKPAQ